MPPSNSMMNQNFPREGNIAFFDGMSEGLDDRTVVQFLSKLNHLKFEGRSTEKGAGFWWCMHFSEQFVDYPVSQFGCIHRPFLMVSTPIITSFRLNSPLVFSSLHAIHQSSFAGCLLSNRWLLSWVAFGCQVSTKSTVHRSRLPISSSLRPATCKSGRTSGAKPLVLFFLPHIHVHPNNLDVWHF